LRLPELREIVTAGILLYAIFYTDGPGNTRGPDNQRKVGLRAENIEILRPWSGLLLLQRNHEIQNAISRGWSEDILFCKALDDQPLARSSANFASLLRLSGSRLLGG